MYFPRSKNCIAFFPSLAIVAQRDFVSGFCEGCHCHMRMWLAPDITFNYVDVHMDDVSRS